MPLFSAADQQALAGLHVHRAWFADVQFASGRRRYHTGIGAVTIGGFTWHGVNAPFGGQLVSVAEVEEPRFGSAPAVAIVFSGADKTFLREVWSTDLEGTPCDLYFAVFDAETGRVIIDLRKLFEGKLTAPAIQVQGLAVRRVEVKVVSFEEGLNYPATRTAWSPAGQRSRYPTDEGMDFIGADIIVDFKA